MAKSFNIHVVIIEVHVVRHANALQHRISFPQEKLKISRVIFRRYSIKVAVGCS